MSLPKRLNNKFIGFSKVAEAANTSVGDTDPYNDVNMTYATIENNKSMGDLLGSRTLLTKPSSTSLER